VGDHEKDLESELPDLDELDLHKVEELPRAVLATALAHLRDEVTQPGEQFSGFQSSL
jgi:FXSXX-COOH protein